MKKTIKACILAVCLVAAFLAVKNEYARHLPSGAYGMQPLIKNGEVDHLFIGSSMFRQGLDIGVLEEQLGDSVYILSYNGNQPMLMAMELEYLLEQGVEIGHLYVDLYGYTAAANPWISDTKILLDTDLRFKMEMWNLMKTHNETKFLDFYELFVTSNNEQILTWPIHNRLLSAQFYKGGTLVHSAGTTEAALAYSLGTREGVHPAQAEGYARIMEFASDHGIALTFIETPKYHAMYLDETYRMLLKECLKLVDGHTAVLFEGMEFDNTDPARFQDLIHLSGEGRKEYTGLLCERLKAAE